MNELKRYGIMPVIRTNGRREDIMGEMIGGQFVVYSEAAALLAEKDNEIARLRVEKDRITKKLGMVQSQFAIKEEALIRDYVKSQTRKQHDIDLLSEKDAEIERLLEALTEIAENFYPTTEYDGALCAVEDMRDIAKQAIAATAPTQP